MILRELRKGNPSSKSSGRGRKIRRPFYFKPDKRRTSLDPESGQAILDREIFTLIYAFNLRLEKWSTLLFRALKRETRPVQLQLARPPSGKSQKQLLLATQNASSEELT